MDGPSSNRFSSLLLEGLDHYRRGRMLDAVRSWEEAYLLEPTNLRAREFLRSALERIHARMSSTTGPAQAGIAFQELQQLVPKVPLEHISGPGIAFRSFERHPWLRPPHESRPGKPLQEDTEKTLAPVPPPEALTPSAEPDDAPAIWEPKAVNSKAPYDLGLEMARKQVTSASAGVAKERTVGSRLPPIARRTPPPPSRPPPPFPPPVPPPADTEETPKLSLPSGPRERGRRDAPPRSPWDDGPSVAIPQSEPPVPPKSGVWKIHTEPTLAKVKTPDETGVWMIAADELMALDDFSGALELVNKVLQLHPNHIRALQIKATCEQNLLQMYESRLGGAARRPRVVLSPDEVIWLNLDPRAGFVLAQIDGTVSFEDLYAICGLTHLDTARILSQLLDEGVIEAVGELNHLF